MPDHEQAMLAYLKLAAVSHEKRQFPGRDRFLLLAGTEACRSGLLDVAETCRELVLQSNSRHMVRRYDTLMDALRDAEFQPFVKQLERFCPVERAEHLLSELGLSVDVPDATTEAAGRQARDILDRMRQ